MLKFFSKSTDKKKSNSNNSLAAFGIDPSLFEDPFENDDESCEINSENNLDIQSILNDTKKKEKNLSSPKQKNPLDDALRFLDTEDNDDEENMELTEEDLRNPILLKELQSIGGENMLEGEELQLATTELDGCQEEEEEEDIDLFLSDIKDPSLMKEFMELNGISGNRREQKVKKQLEAQTQKVHSLLKQYKEAALKSKKENNISQAKEYLRIYKTLEELEVQLQEGQVIDESLLPVPLKENELSLNPKSATQSLVSKTTYSSKTTGSSSNTEFVSRKDIYSESHQKMNIVLEETHAREFSDAQISSDSSLLSTPVKTSQENDARNNTSRQGSVSPNVGVALETVSEKNSKSFNTTSVDHSSSQRKSLSELKLDLHEEKNQPIPSLGYKVPVKPSLKPVVAFSESTKKISVNAKDSTGANCVPIATEVKSSATMISSTITPTSTTNSTSVSATTTRSGSGSNTTSNSINNAIAKDAKPSSKFSSPSTPVNQPKSILEQQLELVTTRIADYRKAALEAKQSGDIGTAKKFLVYSKKIEPLRQQLLTGKPIDTTKVPGPPSSLRIGKSVAKAKRQEIPKQKQQQQQQRQTSTGQQSHVASKNVATNQVHPQSLGALRTKTKSNSSHSVEKRLPEDPNP